MNSERPVPIKTHCISTAFGCVLPILSGDQNISLLVQHHDHGNHFERRLLLYLTASAMALALYEWWIYGAGVASTDDSVIQTDKKQCHNSPRNPTTPNRDRSLLVYYLVSQQRLDTHTTMRFDRGSCCFLVCCFWLFHDDCRDCLHTPHIRCCGATALSSSLPLIGDINETYMQKVQCICDTELQGIPLTTCGRTDQSKKQKRRKWMTQTADWHEPEFVVDPWCRTSISFLHTSANNEQNDHPLFWFPYFVHLCPSLFRLVTKALPNQTWL
jgi:hypothetical protein